MKPVAVGAYLFAGGFTIGMDKHVKTIAHFEDGGYGRAEFDLNFPKIPTFKFDEVEQLQGTSVDVVYANPPCAIFSEAARFAQRDVGFKGADWRTDKRSKCWHEVLTLGAQLDANVVVIESVRAALSPKRGLAMIEGIEAEWLDKGFNSYRVLENARAFGVPQNRKRLLLVLSRVKVAWPAPRGAERTVGEALRSLEPREGRRQNLPKRVLDVLPRVAPGMAVEKVLDHCSFLLRRLDPEGVAGVVFGDKTIHPWEDRLINEHEIKALMGFPPTYELPKSYDSRVLGRGVCPPVGAWLGARLATAIANDVPVREPKMVTVEVT